jgi:hypothetical protein
VLLVPCICFCLEPPLLSPSHSALALALIDSLRGTETGFTTLLFVPLHLS